MQAVGSADRWDWDALSAAHGVRPWCRVASVDTSDSNAGVHLAARNKGAFSHFLSLSLSLGSKR